MIDARSETFKVSTGREVCATIHVIQTGSNAHLFVEYRWTGQPSDEDKIEAERIIKNTIDRAFLRSKTAPGYKM